MQWEWQCDEIDDMGTSLTSMGVALAEDGAGYPIIAYQDGSDDQALVALQVARPHVALDPNTVPNCGPQDLFLIWYCEFIDGGGSYTDEAGSVSLALNSAGLAPIAYHELYSYQFPPEGNLKVAYQRLNRHTPEGFHQRDFHRSRICRPFPGFELLRGKYRRPIRTIFGCRSLFSYTGMERVRR
jgi:hypothetical protein